MSVGREGIVGRCVSMPRASMGAACMQPHAARGAACMGRMCAAACVQLQGAAQAFCACVQLQGAAQAFCACVRGAGAMHACERCSLFQHATVSPLFRSSTRAACILLVVSSHAAWCLPTATTLTLMSVRTRRSIHSTGLRQREQAAGRRSSRYACSSLSSSPQLKTASSAGVCQETSDCWGGGERGVSARVGGAAYCWCEGVHARCMRRAAADVGAPHAIILRSWSALQPPSPFQSRAQVLCS